MPEINTVPFAAVSPEKVESAKQCVEETYRSLNRLPFFMTELDETDGAGGENIALEAIRALAYEGTAVEVAENFKEQGNNFAKEKAWKDARDCYDRALIALKAPDTTAEGIRSNDLGLETVAAQDENIEERNIEEKCLVNRALCNLELQNYRSCKIDCATALRLNSRNSKAIYRCATAFMALDDITRAEEACAYGLTLDPLNESFKILSSKLSQRRHTLCSQQQKRQDRHYRAAKEIHTLKAALKVRNIVYSAHLTAPIIEDAAIRLSDPIDLSSTLTVPMLLLYPLTGQTDFIKGCNEQSTITEHLEYVLPPPWDEKGEYISESVDCLMETTSGGIVKVGKKLTLNRVLSGHNVELVDNMAKLQIIPKARVNDWIMALKKK